MKVREISAQFVSDLKDTNGKLNWVFTKVKAHGSPFALEIREGYINVYYRGGSILKITEIKGKTQDYKFEFDKKYGIRKNGNSKLVDGRVLTETKNGVKKEICWCDFMVHHYDDVVKMTDDTAQRYFDDLKNMMDGWFEEHPKKEREFQHYMSLPRYNDNVLGIEYAIGESGLRFDMVMIDKEGELYIVENKFGNGSISSMTTVGKEKPGLSKHYGDFIKVVTKKDYWSNIKESMTNILGIKQELGLIPSEYRIKLDGNGKPVFHILFVLADLGLSPQSIIIEREKLRIEAEFGRYKNEFPPEVLCVDAHQYRIRLYNSEDMLSFSLK